MNAHLVTRCGCSRSIKTTFPPPEEIHLPMKPASAIRASWLPEPTDHLYDSIPRRIFRLDRRPEHPVETAYYTERSTYEPKETP